MRSFADSSPTMSRANLRRASVLLGSLLVVALASSPALAAEKKNFIPSETTAKKLLKMQEYVEAEDYQAALDELEPLTTKSRLKKYDKAKVFELRGYMLAQLERYPEARKSLETALAQDYLPDQSVEAIKYNLAQLYMADPTPKNLQRAIALLKEWFATAENPGYQAWFLLAAAYAQTEEWDKALPPARNAVEKSEAAGKESEQYYQLLLAMEFQNGNLLESLDVLKILATKYPKKQYYTQLAFAFSNMGDEESALATLQLAYSLGFLDKERELTQLAQRLLFAQLPWQAAKVMMTGLDKKIIEPTSDNYELLANSLLNAREYDKALGPLEKAARLSDEGNLYVRLAQVHLEVENWSEARKALEAGLDKGGIRDSGNAQILLGISNFNEKRYQSARHAFVLATKDENTRDSARKWLEHVDRALADQESSEDG